MVCAVGVSVCILWSQLYNPPAPKPHLFTLSHRPQSRNQVYLENIYNNKIDELCKHFNFLYLLQSNIDLLVTISLEIFILLAFQLVLCLVVWV